MRELKFRAYDIDNGRFLDSYEIDYTRHSDGTLGVADNSEPFNKYGRVILMQYIGLKDRNGVEVYEGDVVAYNFQVHPATKEQIRRNYNTDTRRIEETVIPAKEEQESHSICTVVYDEYNGGFLPFIDDVDFDGITFMNVYGKTFEVIGNIYENSDLLEK